jgi:hypothetical protein
MRFSKPSSKLILISALFCSLFSYGQNESETKKSYLKIGANYLSNAVYSGRKDSEVVSYVRPSLGYFHKSGFFVNGEISLLANSVDAGRLDEVALETGYNFSFKDKLDGGFYGAKYFYSNGSYAVASELQGNLGGYLTYNPGFVRIGGGADILFSTGADITVNANFSHPFEIGVLDNTCTISPTVQVNAGTQTFYRSYYKNRKFSFTSIGVGNNHSTGKGHHINTTSGGSTKVITFPSQNQFDVLDYELLVPVQYETKRCVLYANPVAAFPVNPVSYAIDGVMQTEKLSNSFYIEIGIYFKL